MCLDPISLGVMTLLSGVQEYQSNKAQANAQQSMYNNQAAAAEANAKIQERKGEQIADQYAQEQLKIDARRKIAAGQANAAFGASGLATDYGSGLDVLTSVEESHKEDSRNLLTNQRNEMFDNRVAVTNYQNDANANRAAAFNIGQQSKANGLATILGTATSLAGIKSKYGTVGNTGANKSTNLWDSYSKKNTGKNYSFGGGRK